MSLNLDSLLSWLMEVRFIVGLTAAFSNVNFFPPQHELLFKHCLITIWGKVWGFLLKNTQSQSRGKLILH